MVITYDQRRPEIDDIIAIYQSSGIKRPVQDTDRIREMYRHANLVITAWDGEKPVGIARALTVQLLLLPVRFGRARRIPAPRHRQTPDWRNETGSRRTKHVAPAFRPRCHGLLPENRYGDRVQRLYD